MCYSHYNTVTPPHIYFHHTRTTSLLHPQTNCSQAAQSVTMERDPQTHSVKPKTEPLKGQAAIQTVPKDK